MYAVRVGEGYLYARASTHSLPPLGGNKLPFSWRKCSDDSSITRWRMAPVSFVDDEDCNTTIYGREGLITDAYDIFRLLSWLFVC